MFKDVGVSLAKLDGVLEKLKRNALDAGAALASIREQQQVLDGMSNCPAGMLTKVEGLLSNA